eukprot:TRINITY_DN24473_c0_g1_i1.p1 TRINITY_DN24473_c0_g1~~TRINITY_DN24473_c0_g1_i1.p1  ORF type:complete len:546 (+),score=110.10 TRINITY_DN24473_c0_g1_i1:67-1704(+)
MVAKVGLHEVYRSKCKELNQKPNSSLVNLLKENSNPLEFTKLDLKDNMIGAAGMVPLVEVVKQCPELTEIVLRGNTLTSESVNTLLEVLRTHKRIRSLDLSENDIRLSGPDVLSLLKANPQLTKVSIQDTNMRPLFVNLINMQLKKNNTPASCIRNNSSGGSDSRSNSLPGSGKRIEFSAELDVRDQSPPSSPVAASVVKGNNNFEVVESDPKSPDSFCDENSSREGEHVTFGAFTAFTDDDDAQQPAAPLKKVASRRPTVCAEAYSEEQIDNFRPEVNPKSEEESSFLLGVLERNQLFNHLDDYELMDAVNAFSERPRMMGDFVYEDEDEDMDTFFVIYEGNLHTTDGDRSLSKGDTFGDIFLLYPQASTETVSATSDCVLYALDRITFKFILNKASKKKRAMYEGFLMKVPFLSTLSHIELLQLADALKSSQYEDGQTVIKYGEEGTWLHIVVEGMVEVIGRDDSNNKIKVCEFKMGECVGELEFLNNHKTVADVVAIGRVRTAKMNRRHFEMCMGPVIDILRKNADALEVYSYYRETLARIK